MDGYLSFFEQEAFAFGRFLPGFLIPGPIQYLPKTDSFITCTSSRTVETFKYRVLAVAIDDDDKAQKEEAVSKKGLGKRVTADWSLNIGDHGLEIYISEFTPEEPSIFILGERGLYCLNDKGIVQFMKKLEYNPSCFVPYTSVSDGTVNTMVATHTQQLLIYQNIQLTWAAQLPTLPVAVRVARFSDLNGVIVMLDGQGHVNCCYLGTDPSMFVAPSVGAREFSYEEAQEEMKVLNRIAKEYSKTSADTLPGEEEALQLRVVVPSVLDAVPFKPDEMMEDEDVRPSVSVKLVLRCVAPNPLQNVNITVHCELPLVVDHSIVHIEHISTSDGTPELNFVFFTVGNHLPLSLSVTITASFVTNSGAPRLIQSTFPLPLSLFCSVCPPAKTAEYKITLETNRPTVSLPELFPEFVLEDSPLPPNVMAVTFHSNVDVTVLASKNSQRYRLQSDKFEAMNVVALEFDRRIQKYFGNATDFEISYIGNLPSVEYFSLIEAHLEARLVEERYQSLLAERAQQFRAIQKRLLTRFKDKTPSPLANLDTLIDGTYKQLMAIGEAYEENTAMINQKANALSCGTNLMLYIVRVRTSMSHDEYDILLHALPTCVPPPGEVGWEEIAFASVQHLLRTCLAKTDREQTNVSHSLKLPRDSTRLKKHIALLFDRLLRGGKLSLVPQGIGPIPKSEALSAVADEADSALDINGHEKDSLANDQTSTVSPPPPSAEAAALAVSTAMSAAARKKSRLSPLPEVATGQTV
jgi:Bardet-Biedl syndrome 9 protein